MNPSTNGLVPLVEIRRAERWECTHFGAVAVFDAGGTRLLAVGDENRQIYLRSAAKPFQAMALLQLGVAERFGWTDEEVALVCASHGAQPFHLKIVESILAKAGLTVADLGCGPHEPMEPAAALELHQSDELLTSIHNNCSGKHAGMLAACKHKGWPTESYLDPGHPLQKANARTLATFANLDADAIPAGVDGCGAPAFYLSLKDCAVAFARLAQPGRRPDTFEAHADRVVRSMCTHPVHVAFEGNFGATLIERLGDQLVAKGGAEGVFCAGIRRQGIGIAIKIADGSTRPISAIVLCLLERFLPGTNLEELQMAVLWPITNCLDEVVGDLRVVGL